jgi:shikimate kinase
VIHLIGPGGAGKSTVAPYVAALLGGRAIDLDRTFEALHGDIDAYIQAHGYGAYAAANVDTYLVHQPQELAVVALSAGLMLYSAGVHPALGGLQHAIAAAPTTVLMLPSLDLETCVAEVVRRQTTRPLSVRRSIAREEAVIRERFPRYRRLTSRVVTTMRPPLAVAREIITRIELEQSCRASRTF